MNRLKKEEIRKYKEARLGKTEGEIAELERQDAINNKINLLASALHHHLFPEEYDFMLDSICDAKDRGKGINPMAQNYIKKMDNKREVLGLSLLSKSGMSISGDTKDLCFDIAKECFNNPEFQG